MDLKQVEYIVKIADERSITRAAEKLFVTQSALNQQLLRLEKDLGTKLFYRKKVDFKPTNAGEVYLENARKILQIKNQTYSVIHDMVETKKGYLSIGFTPGRGREMFVNVYPLFHQQYPNIIVEPHELSVQKQQQLIMQGQLDIGFQTLSDHQKINNNYIVLNKEEILLAVPINHPLALEIPQTNEYPVIDLTRLKDDKFILMYQESTMRFVTDEIFKEAGYIPNVLFETSSNKTIISMIQSQLCCGIIPKYYVQQAEGIRCFTIQSQPTWDIVASYQKNVYISNAAKKFIEIAKNFWEIK